MALQVLLRPIASAPTHWHARYHEACAKAAAAATPALAAVYRELAQHYWSMHLWCGQAAEPTHGESRTPPQREHVADGGLKLRTL